MSAAFFAHIKKLQADVDALKVAYAKLIEHVEKLEPQKPQEKPQAKPAETGVMAAIRRGRPAKK
jgi:hypothetical protein